MTLHAVLDFLLCQFILGIDSCILIRVQYCTNGYVEKGFLLLLIILFYCYQV